MDEQAFLMFLDQLKRTVGSENRMYLLTFRSKTWWCLAPKQIRVLLLQSFTRSSDRVVAATILLKKCSHQLSLTELARLLQLISMPKERLALLKNHVQLIAPCSRDMAFLCMTHNFNSEKDRMDAFQLISDNFNWPVKQRGEPEEVGDVDWRIEDSEMYTNSTNGIKDPVDVDQYMRNIRAQSDGVSKSATVFDLSILQRPGGSLNEVVRSSRADIVQEIRRRQASPQVGRFVPSCVGAILDNLNPARRKIFRRHSICDSRLISRP